MVTKDHIHTWELETLPDGGVRRKCTGCPCVIVDHAAGKIAPRNKVACMGRRKHRSKREVEKKTLSHENKTVTQEEDHKSLLKDHGLKGTIEILRVRRTKLQNVMSVTHRYLRNKDTIDYNMVGDYVEMNKKLREIKIFETELTYLKNLL